MECKGDMKSKFQQNKVVKSLRKGNGWEDQRLVFYHWAYGVKARLKWEVVLKVERGQYG
jgi:hypothetical protein